VERIEDAYQKFVRGRAESVFVVEARSHPPEPFGCMSRVLLDLGGVAVSYERGNPIWRRPD